MNLQCPIEKILLPVDGSEASKRAIDFAGVLGSCIGKSIQEVSILRVIAGGYLSRHLAYIDFRAEELIKSSDIFKKLREEHINKNIKPLLDEVERMLRDAGVVSPINKLIVDGDPANEIIRIATDGNYSTIILGRSGISEGKATLGSVTNKVIHGAFKHAVYIVGEQRIEKKEGVFIKILIPVDGTLYSIKGIEHVSCLAKLMEDYVSEIMLLRVINMAFLMERLKNGVDPELEAQIILNEGKEKLLKAGINEKVIKTKVRIGLPAEEIMEESNKDYNLIVMGRKGRSSFKDLIIGGVSSTVIQKCYKPTIAIMSL